MKHLLLTTIAAVVLVGCEPVAAVGDQAETKMREPEAPAIDITSCAAVKETSKPSNSTWLLATDVNAKDSEW